ncbi:putative RNA-binding protein 15 [Orussus abietinus]|uniref:putative RNA-binding protein 15 n=1 Tax=Orussus abietinus TaxID=222816 RepID=UPI000624FC04|nr:putative RNA-binding protein 15 [Orussus abietinus]
MIGIPRDDLHKITVKIRNNMKRSSSRDTPPPRVKRSRSSIGRYEDSSDERMTPERIRRRSRGARSPSPPGRGSSASHHARGYPESSSHRDDYLRGARDLPPDRPYGYKVLCVSSIHPKASDEAIKDTLYREYKKFGDFSIRISHELDERVAYVCFRSSEDARDAKHAKPRIIVYDKLAIVEPVYERPGPDSYRRPRSLTPPDYDRYYARSPGPERHHRPLERYDRLYGPPPVGLPPHREVRRETLPPPHHDFVRPPVHHAPPHVHPGGGGSGGGGGGPPHHYGPPRHLVLRHPVHGFERVENKKDKFPNYLHHVSPEDDPLATRTLFAGNLEINITEEELRRIFSKYGIVDDIDIKRPPPGTGNAYAFVRFQTLDMAHRCKVELSGQYIGKFQCKIGYGKATPTTRIWVGGLGPWTSVPQLEREFDRFGAIKKIDYIKGDSNAYILYDSIDAAQAAVKEMRGFPLGGPDRRLRVDFADVTPGFGFKPRPYPEDSADFRQRPLDYDSPYDPYGPDGEFGYASRGFRGRGSAPWHERRGGGGSSGGGGGGRGAYRGSYPEGYAREEDWAARRPTDLEYEAPRNMRRSVSREPGVDRSRSRSPRRRPLDSDTDSENARTGMLSLSRTLTEVARKSVAVWQGALILKNSLFPAKFHLTDGDTEIIDSLMKDEEGKHMLRITQRLRLDQPKLDDVSKRIQTSSSHAIFLGLAGSSAAVTNEDANVQTRPLRNLVSYLKQKEAAGVISLLNKDTEGTGVLYAFPPCAFSTELLKRTCPSLSEEGLKEDHLVIVVVKGGSA